MRHYVAFDDTDTLNCGRETGKLARWYRDELPEGCTMWGVIRQQLLFDRAIPMTSHNSSLCCVINAPDDSLTENLIERAVSHIKNNFFEGSDPGLCVISENDKNLDALIAFSIECTRKKVTQKDALDAVSGKHLSGHGGTNDGIIGAAAAVGLTLNGESGRFVDYAEIRNVENVTKVSDLK